MLTTETDTGQAQLGLTSQMCNELATVERDHLRRKNKVGMPQKEDAQRKSC